MVDPGEKISATLKREFGEEALNSLQKSSAEKREIEEKLHALFSQEHLVVRSSCLVRLSQAQSGGALGSAHKAPVLKVCSLALPTWSFTPPLPTAFSAAEG